MRKKLPVLKKLINHMKAFLSILFDSFIARSAKKVMITIAGLAVTLVGVAFIILPGPAFILLPAGLAILAIEYPLAKKWLRKVQAWMNTMAKKADGFFARSRAKN